MLQFMSRPSRTLIYDWNERKWDSTPHMQSVKCWQATTGDNVWKMQVRSRILLAWQFVNPMVRKNAELLFHFLYSSSVLLLNRCKDEGAKIRLRLLVSGNMIRLRWWWCYSEEEEDDDDDDGQSRASIQMQKPPVQENKHLSCAKPSVKCTNCGGEPLFPPVALQASVAVRQELRGIMATVIYWSSASFPTIQSGCVTCAEGAETRPCRGCRAAVAEQSEEKRWQIFRSFIEGVCCRPLAAMMPFPLVRLRHWDFQQRKTNFSRRRKHTQSASSTLVSFVWDVPDNKMWFCNFFLSNVILLTLMFYSTFV